MAAENENEKSQEQQLSQWRIKLYLLRHLGEVSKWFAECIEGMMDDEIHYDRAPNRTPELIRDIYKRNMQTADYMRHLIEDIQSLKC